MHECSAHNEMGLSLCLCEIFRLESTTSSTRATRSWTECPSTRDCLCDTWSRSWTWTTARSNRCTQVRVSRCSSLAHQSITICKHTYAPFSALRRAYIWRNNRRDNSLHGKCTRTLGNCIALQRAQTTQMLFCVKRSTGEITLKYSNKYAR